MYRNKAELLEAMKATDIPEEWSGLWFVVKQSVTEPLHSVRFGKPVVVPAGTITYLRCLTDSTIQLEPCGELVMEDTPFELKTHLGFVMQAYGNVLVTGLGLGCVVRGLLHNPNVEHVTCIEKSPDVMKLVAPYMPTDRLTIVEDDALKWTATNKDVFDCAWHDLWTNKDAGEPHLDVWHANLIMNCHKTVKHQGAWAFDRIIKHKIMTIPNFHWMG